MDSRIRLITTLMAEQKGSTRLSAKEAGSLLAVSECHFLRLFKLEMGTTFRRYRRAARIGGVVNLLAENLVSTKQVASAAGYEDISNFHRDFKQVCGISPRQWRMRNLAGLHYVSGRLELPNEIAVALAHHPMRKTTEET